MVEATARVEQIALAQSGTAWNKRTMPTTYPRSESGAPQVPKDGKLYWIAPGPHDEFGVHLFRRWDSEKNRWEDRFEGPGMQPITSRHQKIPAIPPRADGTILKEGVGYDPIEIT